MAICYESILMLRLRMGVRGRLKQSMVKVTPRHSHGGVVQHGTRCSRRRNLEPTALGVHVFQSEITPPSYPESSL